MRVWSCQFFPVESFRCFYFWSNGKALLPSFLLPSCTPLLFVLGEIKAKDLSLPVSRSVGGIVMEGECFTCPYSCGFSSSHSLFSLCLISVPRRYFCPTSLTIPIPFALVAFKISPCPASLPSHQFADQFYHLRITGSPITHSFSLVSLTPIMTFLLSMV